MESEKQTVKTDIKPRNTIEWFFLTMMFIASVFFILEIILSLDTAITPYNIVSLGLDAVFVLLLFVQWRIHVNDRTY